MDSFSENIQNFVKSILKGHFGTAEFTTSVEVASAPGDNYFGIVYRVAAKRLSNEDRYSIIVKTPPKCLMRRHQFLSEHTFAREALVYEQILPTFSKFQEIKNITSTENQFYEIPFCYKTITADLDEAIFLEDLQINQFYMFNRNAEQTFDHVALLMKVLGKFHGISLAMKDQDINRIKPFIKLNEILLNHQSETFAQLFGSLVQRAKTTLNPKTESRLLEKFNHFFNDLAFIDHFANINGESAEPYAVLCHGDCWNNNILYQNNKDGKPTEVRLLDWQRTKYASPVCDLSYFFFCCTSKEFRNQHYNDLLEVYYKSLNEMISRLGSEPKTLFPRQAFNEQLKKFSKYGLIMATILLPMFTLSSEEMPNLTELSQKADSNQLNVENLFRSQSSDKIYQQRMHDVIIDMDGLGYF